MHGVREAFINEGRRRAQHSLDKKDLPLDEEVEDQVYYIGKLLWAKGFEQMLELEEFYHLISGKYFAVDIYGSGPEEDEIKRAFHGRRLRRKQSQPDDSGHRSLSGEYIAKKFQSIKMTSQEFEIPKTFYEWRRRPIPAKFLGPVDHASLGEKYKVFVNPSISEVLCTTTFEG